MEQTVSYLEHAEDVLDRWLAWRERGGVALIIVTTIEGGAVRAPGAMMAVAEDGETAGYISGGCIDADVVLQAQAAIKAGKARALRYGAGSPFTDLPLPCGGAIEVTVLPDANPETLRACHDRLVARETVRLSITPEGTVSLDPAASADSSSFHYTPKLRLRIAGRGADCLALARAAEATGIETTLWLPDGDDADQATRMGLAEPVRLKTPNDLPPAEDDAWTAFVLAFHDRDWETGLLTQALAGPAFYIGAIGSRRTHARRCETLREAGQTAHQIARIRGPVGLIPSMRDASLLAVSILAEVIEAHQQKRRTPFARTALILLAAGQSQRFAAGDKLLASLTDQPIIDRASGALADETVGARIAVIGPDQDERAAALTKAGWQIVLNPHAAEGQSTSLKAGLDAAGQAEADIDAAMILLADMPCVPDAHLHALRDAMTPDKLAVMSATGDTRLPPAIFSRAVFDRLGALTGDTGAKRVFETLDNTATVALSPDQAVDIDTTDDLQQLEGLTHA
ncbi:NTP transferase domain-containing protein [Henriciella aquimarina]|uniref:NTP transferase domain-containing protein n=1 Tax=Henriciella aquimarina TaxID=545261 RepID=UPI000A00971D|nr:NTP transferase domain-containing protein [Henriciella aquimarina]